MLAITLKKIHTCQKKILNTSKMFILVLKKTHFGSRVICRRIRFLAELLQLKAEVEFVFLLSKPPAE